jgi:hypothetical protein
MTERTTETEITFAHPFELSSFVKPFDAGTYRLIVDEEEVEGLSFSVFKRTATQLEIPALETAVGTRQRVRVSSYEIDSALAKDARTTE